jgi:hypothetical protein
VRSNDAVARDEDSEVVLSAECSGGAGRAWAAGEGRELAVRDDLATPDVAERTCELATERRQFTQIELDVLEADLAAGEVPAQPRDQTWCEIVTAACVTVR